MHANESQSSMVKVRIARLIRIECTILAAIAKVILIINLHEHISLPAVEIKAASSALQVVLPAPSI
jgi:hypothetical protein